MSDTPQSASNRLDSWKAIAAYLGRDERTVRRWEKDAGLPVRRVPGKRGTSVFAFASEIDAWLHTSAARESALLTSDSAPTAPPSVAPSRRGVPWRMVALGLLGLAAIATWRVLAPRASARAVNVRTTATGLVATDDAGAERWRYEFPAGVRIDWPTEPQPVVTLDGANPEVLATISNRARLADSTALSGELLWFSLASGRLQRTVSLDDQLTFTGGSYGPPWTITDVRVNGQGASRKIAVVAHHKTWWPSFVTVIDDAGQRVGTFVNAGWIEQVRWLSPDRLVVAGFSNAEDAAVVALLDARAVAGQSPTTIEGGFTCPSCGPVSPLRYVVFPRTELNRAMGAPFNRARVDISADRIVVRTIENFEIDLMPEAIYELTPGLDVKSATYGDRYWEVHRALETRGLLKTSRATAPDRDGPLEIRTWDSRNGWQTVRINRR